MHEHAFVIVRDARGSVVHVRDLDGECIGCIDAGLFAIVRALVLKENAPATASERRSEVGR